MIEIEDLGRKEAEELLNELNYGHLGCSDDGQPYVVPIHFALSGLTIYIYTTDGKKSRIIEKNPRICLQAEKIITNEDWKSVIVYGSAVQILDEAERSRALQLIAEINPTMTPAVSVRWIDSWIKENVEVIYRVNPETITGRATIDRSVSRVPFAPTGNDPQIN